MFERLTIPVSQKVTTANNVQMTILGAIVVKLTSVSSGLSTLQLCYIAKECCGVYVSLNACKNLSIVHDTFPQPAARLNVTADASDISDSCKRVTDNHNFPTAPCGCPVRALPSPWIYHFLHQTLLGSNNGYYRDMQHQPSTHAALNLFLPCMVTHLLLSLNLVPLHQQSTFLLLCPSIIRLKLRRGLIEMWLLEFWKKSLSTPQ